MIFQGPLSRRRRDNEAKSHTTTFPQKASEKQSNSSILYFVNVFVARRVAEKTPQKTQKMEKIGLQKNKKKKKKKKKLLEEEVCYFAVTSLSFTRQPTLFPFILMALWGKEHEFGAHS